MSLKTELAEIARRADLTGSIPQATITRVLCEYRDAPPGEKAAVFVHRKMGGKPSLPAIQAVIDVYERMLAERFEVSSIEFEEFARGAPRNWRREYALGADQGALI